MTMTRHRSRVIALGLALAAATAACSSGASPTPDPSGLIPGATGDCPTDGKQYPADARPASTAKITIVKPTRGQIVRGDSTTIRVKLAGACVLSRSQNTIRPDTGHVHIGLDGKTLDIFAGLRYELTDLTPGSHILEVEFSAADHAPFSPPVTETVVFKVVEAG